jgi:predicted secreted protein
MGSSGVEIIKFRAIAAGKSEVKLIFHRSFEHNVPPLKTFGVTVIIKKSLS